MTRERAARVSLTLSSSGTEWHRCAGTARVGTAAPHLLALLLALFIAAPLFAQSSAPPKLPGRVGIAQKLGSQIPLDLMFRDETGKVVRLNQYFNHGRPVLLNFVYYTCPMLCPMVLEGMTSAMSELKFDVGQEYDIITVSIDPRDKPSQAAAFKDKYVRRYGRLSAANGWHFLTGPDNAIKSLADSVGFEYAYDGTLNQFAHGAAMMVLTPEGKMSRYFYGFEFRARDLRLAIVEASGNKIGTTTDQILLLCYHYDPATGKYSRSVMNFVRTGGIATVLVLGGFILLMLRRDRHGANTPQESTSR